MYIGIVMKYVTNITLVGIVVWIVMGRNLIGINIIVTIGVGLISGLESGKIIGLTGEYGQLIIEYGIVAIILPVLAILIMDREKEKKGMERVELIVLAALGIIILVGAEDLLTVYLAMEAPSLASSFYTLAELLGVIAVSSFLGVLRAESTLVSGFHTEYSAVLFFLFVMIELVSYLARAISLGVRLAANISASHLLLTGYSFSSVILL